MNINFISKREFVPDYTNIVTAAYNKVPKRTSLYELTISKEVMEQVTGKKFGSLSDCSTTIDMKEYFYNEHDFYKSMGYDTVIWSPGIVSIFPSGGALSSPNNGAIKNRQDFEKYPFAELPIAYSKRFALGTKVMGKSIPIGMKAMGGPSYGVFECVQDLVGYENLCYMMYDNPDLFADLFRTVGDVIFCIWEDFLQKFDSYYCLYYFGDDLGFDSSLLLPKDIITTHILPQYKRIVNLIHSYNKPFLLHSCGNIFSIMDNLIEDVKIDAKHSNENKASDFSRWINEFGSKIGIFGGIDVDDLCRKNLAETDEIVKDIYNYCAPKGGFAIGTGNSIPSYVPVENYINMVERVRYLRGDFS